MPFLQLQFTAREKINFAFHQRTPYSVKDACVHAPTVTGRSVSLISLSSLHRAVAPRNKQRDDRSVLRLLQSEWQDCGCPGPCRVGSSAHCAASVMPGRGACIGYVLVSTIFYDAFAALFLLSIASALVPGGGSPPGLTWVRTRPSPVTFAVSFSPFPPFQEARHDTSASLDGTLFCNTVKLWSRSLSQAPSAVCLFEYIFNKTTALYRTHYSTARSSDAGTWNILLV